MYRLLACALLFLFACNDDPVRTDAKIVDAGANAIADAAPLEDASDGRDAESRDGEPDADPTDAESNGDAEVANDGGFVPTFSQLPIDNSFIHGQATTLIDIENDGDLDVLGAISLTDTVRLYLNSGDGSSWNKVDVAQPRSIVAMHSVAADLDGDGDLDVAAVGLFDRDIGFASPGEVVWYRNPGNPAGAWVEQPITGLSFWGPRYLAVGDLTGEGNTDLVVGALSSRDQNGGAQGNGVHWFRNTGGAFAGPSPIDGALSNVAVVLVHDVNDNGVPDVIAAGFGSNEIVWYENQRTPGTIETNPTFVRHTIFSIREPNGLALAQRDGDTTLELFASGDNGSGGMITWLDPPANPTNPWSSNPVATDFGAGNPIRLAAADLNLDGRVDVAAAGTDRVRAYVDDGGGSWIERPVQDAFTGADFVASGDIDRDGIPDLVTSTYAFDPNFDRFDWWRVRR